MTTTAATRHALRPYQEEGVEFLTNTTPFAMLGDDPGLGKSAQAILAADNQTGRILILCPAIARVSWKQQLQQWAARPMKFDVHSYDEVGLKANRKLRDGLRELHYGTLILDEAHYLKNAGANRTKAVYGKGGIGESVRRVFAMSGTFAPNHAGELYPHLKFGGRFPGTKTEFEDQFCKVRDTPFGRQIVGSKNIDKLRELLKPIYLKRRKQDVLKEIPPLQFVDEALDIDASALPAEFQDEHTPSTDDEVINWLNTNTTHVATARRLLGLAKVEPTAQWAEGLLAGGVRKLILFAHHKDVIDRLTERLIEWNPVRLTGASTQQQRMLAVDAFQGDPDVRVFIGQIQAAGTAITLTSSSDVGIVEASWTPSDNFQAACRAHRIGQRDGVVCRFLFVPGTLDARIAKAFRRKAEEISAIFE